MLGQAVADTGHRVINPSNVGGEPRGPRNPAGVERAGTAKAIRSLGAPSSGSVRPMNRAGLRCGRRTPHRAPWPHSMPATGRLVNPDDPPDPHRPLDLSVIHVSALVLASFMIILSPHI